MTTKLKDVLKRNARVEADKAWETSWTGRSIIAFFTWVFLGLYMSAIGVDNPWLNALIPAFGFLLGTLSLPFFKKWWIAKVYRG